MEADSTPTPETPMPGPTPNELELEQARKAATAEPGGHLAAIRDRILAADDLKRKPIDLSEYWPELDGIELFVCHMTAGDRSRYEASMDFDSDGEPRARDNIQAKLVIRTLVDRDGHRIFADEDLELVTGKSSGAIQEIFELGAELNGLTKESIANIEKNSGATPTDS